MIVTALITPPPGKNLMRRREKPKIHHPQRNNPICFDMRM